jgi:hypothetical protein
VHEVIFEKYPEAEIKCYVVWINILPEDSLKAALPLIKFLNDSRIQHFYDPHQKSGKAVAKSVGWEGKMAWDIYLFYSPDIEWTDIPPKPVCWMHQVSADWARNGHYHTGDELKRELTGSLKMLLGK